MMDQLEVPLHLAGVDVHRHQAVAIKTSTRTLAAIKVGGRLFHRQIHQTRIRIRRHLRPNTRVAGIFVGVLQPGLRAGLALLRNGVELPDLLARAHIIRPRRTLVVLEAAGREAFAEGRTDQHLVAHNRRRRLPADLARGQVRRDLLIVIRLQIHRAIVAERSNPLAGLGVQRDQLIARRGVEDARFLAVAPINRTAAGKLARRGSAACAFLLAMHPDQLARHRIQRNHRAARAGRGIDHPAHFQRRALELEFLAVADVVSLEAPGHFQLGEVRRVDLVQRLVFAAVDVAQIDRPIHILPRLRNRNGSTQHQTQQPRPGK